MQTEELINSTTVINCSKLWQLGSNSLCLEQRQLVIFGRIIYMRHASGAQGRMDSARLKLSDVPQEAVWIPT